MAYKLAYTGGTFDLFHAGHVELLRYCAKIADSVVVALNTDAFIRQYKGHGPVIQYSKRKDVLEACRYVDRVICNYGNEDSKPAIIDSGADVIVIGMDWLDRDYCRQMDFDASWLNTNNISLCYVPRTTGMASSDIVVKIR